MTEQFARPAYPHPFTRVRDKETGHHFSAPYPADRLPDHLEALDQPALDRNGFPLPAKPNRPIKPTRSSSRTLSPVAGDMRDGKANPADQPIPEAKEAEQQ